MKWRNEQGLTLVELLAGLLLFSLVATMLYGVLFSGYSLKAKVSSQATIQSQADALVNTLLTSLQNSYGVSDVTSYMTATKGMSVGGLTKQADIASPLPISALWTTQREYPGTPQQRWVNYLYQIVPADDSAGDASPALHKHYKLVRQTFTVPSTQAYLPFTETSYFKSGGQAPDADSTIQLNDPRFPLLNESDPGTSEKPLTSALLADYSSNYDGSIEFILTLCEYDPKTQQESPAYQFQSRVHVD